MRIGVPTVALFFASLLSAVVPAADEPRTLRAGAAKVEVTPQQFPVIMNGNFFAKNATGARDQLYARGLVLDDGRTKLAIVVVDACMLTRELLDAAKALASEATGIPTDRMLISATHTHSSPSGMGCLGTPIDPEYASFLRLQIADCIKQAAKKLVPARVGSASVDVWTHTFCRAWIRRPDRMLDDPFGVKNVRSNMHPGHESPDVVGPVSPVDPEFTLLSVQTAEGKPLALLANYSMHYFGVKTPEVSSDYTGRWCRRMEEELGSQADAAMPFTAIFSQGTSGDSMWMDYSKPKPTTTLEEYTEGLVDAAVKLLPEMKYASDGPLGIAERKITLKRRIPDADRLKWAHEKLSAMEGRGPKDRPEVYAQEAIYLHEEPERELKLQAIRIGDFGIAAIPNEVFAISGLKIKRQSPLAKTMNIELANGSEGYIPPPYQHPLGGYTTWPVRTAALEVQAEPKIVETIVGLLEQLAARPRPKFRHDLPFDDEDGPYARAVRLDNPVGYWRLNDWEGPTPQVEGRGSQFIAEYRGNVAYYLPGATVGPADPAAQPERPSAFSGTQINRSVQLAGGHLHFNPNVGLSLVYSAEFWFWNALPGDAREVTGYLFSRGDPRGADRSGEHLAVSGTGIAGNEMRLVFTERDGAEPNVGKTRLERYRWHHVVLTRMYSKLHVYLNGKLEIEAKVPGEPSYTAGAGGTAVHVFFGARSDGAFPFEGRLDEIALYGDPHLQNCLPLSQVPLHYEAARSGIPPAAKK